MPQQEAAAVCKDRAENQLEDALQQLIDVEDMARRLGGLVHDREVRQGLAQPGGVFLRLQQDAAAFAFANGLDDRGGKLDIGARNKVDLLCQLADVQLGLIAAGAEDQHGLPDGDVI